MVEYFLNFNTILVRKKCSIVYLGVFIYTNKVFLILYLCGTLITALVVVHYYTIIINAILLILRC